jgi:hypothetical protein
MPPVSQVSRQDRNGDAKKKGNILSRIKPVGFSANDPIKVLMYGKSGTGKTHTWSTFPKPIIALVCSGGLNSGELRTVDTEETRKTIRTAIVEASSDIVEVTTAIKAGELSCKTLVLDHATGLQDLILAEVLGITIDKLPQQKSYGIAKRQDWGQVTTIFKDSIKEMLNLPINVVIVSHEKLFNPKEDDENIDVVIKPFIAAGLTPGIVGWLNGAVDYIVQNFKRRKIRTVVTEVGEGIDPITTETPTKEVEYCLKIGKDNTIITKFRVPLEISKRLPDAIVDPTYEKLIRAISGKLTKPVEKKVVAKPL